MSVNALFNLSGKTALVTGGGQGIGRAIVLALAENGANVIVNYLSNYVLARQTAEEAALFGVKVWLWPFDLSQNNIVEAYQKFVLENGCNVDILVTNASMQIRENWDEISDNDFEKQINVNIRSTLRLIESVTPYMKKNKWGRILNIGSVQQVRPHNQMCVYAATKAALVNLVKNLVPQLAPYGITINNLAPGTIHTGRNNEVLADMDYRKKTEATIPLGFIGEPIDCAGLALLLCSDAGRYITGVDYLVDGGMGLCY
ncbi:MAG TPA: short-chain dehydrogenase [Dysgonomonas sp.]|nr:short-chain dehydrogenase [Dysgonomonas sp.]